MDLDPEFFEFLDRIFELLRSIEDKLVKIEEKLYDKDSISP